MTRSSSLNRTRRPHLKVTKKFQEEHSTPLSEEQSGDTEDTTNCDEFTHLTMVHKSLSIGTEAASDVNNSCPS